MTKSSKLVSDLRKAYVDVLAKHNKLYHFDDDAHDITDEHSDQLFEPWEVGIINQLSAALHDDELFQLALEHIEQS